MYGEYLRKIFLFYSREFEGNFVFSSLSSTQTRRIYANRLHFPSVLVPATVWSYLSFLALPGLNYDYGYDDLSPSNRIMDEDPPQWIQRSMDFMYVAVKDSGPISSFFWQRNGSPDFRWKYTSDPFYWGYGCVRNRYGLVFSSDKYQG